MEPTPSDQPTRRFDLEAVAQRLGYLDPLWDLSPFACPHCARVHLYEAELQEVWLDPADLARTAVVSSIEPFVCLGCGHAVQMERGRPAGGAGEVDDAGLRASGWAWALRG